MKYIKFYRYLLPYWKREALVLSLSLITMALGLVNPYLTKLIIDKAYGNKDLKLFIVLMVVGGIIFILGGAINGLSNYLIRYIKLKVNFDLNRKVFKKLQGLSYSFFQNTSTGEHLYKISYDIEQTTAFIVNLLPQAVSLIPKSLLILVIVFYLNWKMTLFALMFIPLLYIVPYYFTQRLTKVFKVWIENSQGIFMRLQEALSHIQLIKAFGKERQEVKNYIRNLIKNIRFGLDNTRLEEMGSFANNLVNRIVLGLIIFYGGYQVIKGKMTLGSLSAITIYLNQLSGLQSSLAQFFQQISLGFISCQRLETILDAPAFEFRDDTQAKEIIFPKGRMEFKNLTFGYKPDKRVLESLSFCIEAGSCIALVGPSGCGKTTIINLLLRLYKLDNGQIHIDGYNIELIKSKIFYEQIGVVLQEPYLWNDTVENNIRYGKEGANFKEIEEAGKIACIDTGYRTVIGENACKISEGQKQRIAIARAVIKRPKILILDEALSSVDAEIESKIIDNIRGAFNRTTTIIISHRLSTIKKMDLVYFLASPDKIEVDTHQGLLGRNIRYQTYLGHQLKEERIVSVGYDIS